MLTLLHLLSSIALLIWGTHIVRTGIMRVYGAHLRRFLGHSTTNPYLAFGAGIGVTALVQSSNATALFVLSFVAQKLVPLATALAIMLGADVGTALMTRVLTLNLSWLSPLLTLVGVCLFMSRRQTRLGQLGRVLIGLGLIILALELIVQAARPITETHGLDALFSSLAGDTLLAALFGALFAVISYSSLAAVLLTATLAGAGLIGLPAALGVVIGASIGSGFIAWMNASVQPTPARQLALGNLLFKLAGLLVLPIIDPLAAWMQTFTFAQATLVIGFHLAYNSARCLLQLPLIQPMARLCEHLLPDRTLPSKVAQPRHLDHSMLDTPSLALASAVRESLRIGDLVDSMLTHLRTALHEDRPQLNTDIRALDDDIDSLYSAIKLYLAQLPRDELSEEESWRWAQIIELAINLELSGDIIEHMAKKLRQPKTGSLRPFTALDLEELSLLLGLLADNLHLGLSVFLCGDERSALQLIEQKHSFRKHERTLSHAHVDRLHEKVLDSLETSSAHLELIADMRRLNSLFCSTAYAVLEIRRARQATQAAEEVLDEEQQIAALPRGTSS
ncbi:Na/Pi cotransporter family protein [Azomonas macrocytogenes]|uniref:Phosphate:Na+ symporter n=1 Tax=Azomonas macrocytogenes TaxID=69962 RepID=A0A839T7B9_AZOMA|nr:Na/Pi cotransporter family protein [Azomonas macrocytogenes]MBB3103855.1 phosphate:Na+ symporter [Azomonas macrocytogenes]